MRCVSYPYIIVLVNQTLDYMASLNDIAIDVNRILRTEHGLLDFLCFREA